MAHFLYRISSPNKHPTNKKGKKIKRKIRKEEQSIFTLYNHVLTDLGLFQGVPLRIEIGPRDVSSGSVVISRRDIPGKQGKVFGISMEPLILVACVKDKLDEIQSSFLARATSFRDRSVVIVLLPI